MLLNNIIIFLALGAVGCRHVGTPHSCNKSPSCVCIATSYDIEFYCPDSGDFEVIVKIDFERGVVDLLCTRIEEFVWSNMTLPVLDVGDVSHLRFRHCPLPNTFIEIVKKLGIQGVQELAFEYSEDLENTTLTFHHFKEVSKLNSLRLAANNIKRIQKNAFAAVSYVKQLDLSENSLQLFGREFNWLVNLEVLDLSRNYLDNIPTDLFKDLHNLKELHLWGNNVHGLDKDLFSNLRNLELLELSRNKIKILPGTLFYPLGNLTQISLSENKLQEVPQNIFSKNTQIQVIKMSRNFNLTYLPSKIFANLSKLEIVNLGNCKLNNMGSNIFENSINLKSIYLEGNALDNITNTLFRNLVALESIELSYNNITHLPNDVFLNLTQLIHLNLEGNSIENLSAEVFQYLEKLEVLNLSKNKINNISEYAFYALYNLRTILLSYNHFDFSSISSTATEDLELFNNNQYLTTIDLSHNQISAIANFVMLTNLRHLDLSFNNINYITFSNIFTLGLPIEINLKYNNISTISFDDAELIARIQDDVDEVTSDHANRIIYFEGNPVVCNCFMFSLSKYLMGFMDKTVRTLVSVEVGNSTCAGPADFVGYPVKNLKPSMLTCSLQELEVEHKASNCSYAFRPWNSSLLVNCSRLNLTEPPMLHLPERFFKQTEVYLDNNMLTVGPNENMGYESVAKLDLSSNNLMEFTWVPPQLKMLKLDHNNIQQLDENILKKLNVSEVTSITLSGNPWRCDCTNENLISFVTSASRRKSMDIEDTYCADGETLLVDLTPLDVCPTKVTSFLWLGIAICLLFLLVAVLAALYYRFVIEIKIWLFAHNMFLWFVTEEELDKDKAYDAFICYSHKDEEFVLNDLLPVLEKGPHPYKLCLHVRDWVAGEFISKQITASITDSRRTVIILSRNFIESEWGKLEFRTAHKQAIDEQRARVILILYGDVDFDDLDEELRVYVRTNTYLKWGDPWFWNKLRYALPHYKNNTQDTMETPV